MEAYKRWFRHFAVLFSLGVLVVFYAGVIESVGAPAPLKRRPGPAPSPHPAWVLGDHVLQWAYADNLWDVTLYQDGSATLTSRTSRCVWVGVWRYREGKLHVKEWQYLSDRQSDAPPNFSYSMAFEGNLWRHTRADTILLYRDTKPTD